MARAASETNVRAGALQQIEDNFNILLIQPTKR